MRVCPCRLGPGLWVRTVKEREGERRIGREEERGIGGSEGM